MLLSLSETVPSELMKLHSASECSRLCKNQPLCQVMIDNVDEAWRLKIQWKMFTIIGNYLFSFMNWDLGISCLHLDDCVKLCQECKQTVWSLFRRGTSMSTLVAISSRSKLPEKTRTKKNLDWLQAAVGRRRYSGWVSGLRGGCPEINPAPVNPGY